MELTKNTSCHSQLSCNLERNIVKLLTLTGKQTERTIQKKLSTIYHLIMSVFYLFYFLAFMNILPQLGCKYA